MKVNQSSPVPTSLSSNTKAKASPRSRSRSAAAAAATSTYARSKCEKVVIDAGEGEGEGEGEGSYSSQARPDSQAPQFSESCEDDKPFNNDELMYLADIFDKKNKYEYEGGCPSLADHDDDLHSILSLDRETIAEDFVCSIFDL